MSGKHVCYLEDQRWSNSKWNKWEETARDAEETALVANKGVGTRVPSCNWANMGKLSEQYFWVSSVCKSEHERSSLY